MTLTLKLSYELSLVNPDMLIIVTDWLRTLLAFLGAHSLLVASLIVAFGYWCDSNAK